jgi:hypothetical protein
MPLPLLLQRLQPTTLLAQASTASTTAMLMQMPLPQCCRTTRPLLLLLELQLPLLKAVQSQQPPVLPSQRPYTTWGATMALELHSSVSFYTLSKSLSMCCVVCMLFCVIVSAVLPIASSLTNPSQFDSELVTVKHLHAIWTCLKQETSNRSSEHIYISWISNRIILVHGQAPA